MDEILFRSSQKIENAQVHLGLAASHTKHLIRLYSEQSKSFILEAWNSAQSAQLRQNMRDIWQIVFNKSQELQYKLAYYANVLSPKKLYLNLVGILSKEWTKRDVYFLCVGFVCGGLIGITIGLVIKKREPILRYMQAVQCTHYMGIESACVIENAIAPYECSHDEVLINVKAASVQGIDAKICSGYGKNIRRILQRVYHSKSDLPVTLGRDCTGIITDAGMNVKRLEVGDEVWLTVPFWHEGTLSQSVVVQEKMVARKPKTIGFEGACSLPYAGSLALAALQHAHINAENAEKKRVFIHGGCTPVGCVLLQILSHWKAQVTISCYRRAVPVAKALGASDIIPLTDKIQNIDGKTALNIENTYDIQDTLPKELDLRDRFDIIIVTRDCSLSNEELMKYCKDKNQTIISTLPPVLSSDNYGLIRTFFYDGWIRLKYLLEKLFSLSLNEFQEVHMCYVLLDELAEMVENGYLQTVVDKVYHTQDIELALAHIQSTGSIGSTIITFR